MKDKDTSFMTHILIATLVAVATAALFMVTSPRTGENPGAEAEKEQPAENQSAATPASTSSLSAILDKSPDGRAAISPVGGDWLSFVPGDDDRSTALIWLSDGGSGAAYPYLVSDYEFCVAWDADGDEGFVSQTRDGRDPKTEKEYGRRYVIHLPASEKKDMSLSTVGAGKPAAE